MPGKPFKTSFKILYYDHCDSIQNSPVAHTSKNFLSTTIDLVETNADRKRYIFQDTNIAEIQEPNNAFSFSIIPREIVRLRLFSMWSPFCFWHNLTWLEYEKYFMIKPKWGTESSVERALLSQTTLLSLEKEAV